MTHIFARELKRSDIILLGGNSTLRHDFLPVACKAEKFSKSLVILHWQHNDLFLLSNYFPSRSSYRLPNLVLSDLMPFKYQSVVWYHHMLQHLQYIYIRMIKYLFGHEKIMQRIIKQSKTEREDNWKTIPFILLLHYKKHLKWTICMHCNFPFLCKSSKLSFQIYDWDQKSWLTTLLVRISQGND